MKKIILALCLVFCTFCSAYAERVWINNLRSNFLNKSSIMMEINPRTFNASDVDGDGLINVKDGDEKGTFLSAIARLDAMRTYGIDTLVVMPITQVGKIKALGTAGSLYATADFTKINPQLVNEKAGLSDIEQAKKFVKEAHNRGLNVIVDLPAFGAYDLFLRRPELFAKNSNGEMITPANWTDVLMLDAGTEENYNKDVFEMYKGFVDLVQEIEFDGVRACSPSTKTAKFWQDLITYSRKYDQQFLWIAQTNDSANITNAPVKTSTEKLLLAGFDGTYGNIVDIRNSMNAKELNSNLSELFNYVKKHQNKDAIVGAFATHDDLSTMLAKGYPYTIMLYWLNAVLPVNSYVLDGNQSGDGYVYGYGNKRAPKSDTDDDQYFVNRGKIDIFNYSRRPGGANQVLMNEYVMSNQFKRYFSSHLNNGEYKLLKTTNADIFAFGVTYNHTTIVVMGNINYNSFAKGEVKLPKISNEKITIPVKISDAPLIEKGKVEVNLTPGEIQILLVNDYEL